MGVPYLPLYAADYLGDTKHLTLEQHGAYLLLLMCMWRAGGELPNDDVKIARMLGVTPARWTRIKPEIMAFMEANEAYFWSPRLVAELKKSGEKHAQKSRAGRAGVEAKALKTHKSTRRLLKQPEPKSESEPKEEGSKDPPSTAREVALAIWGEIPRPAKTRSSGKQLEAALSAAAKRGKNLAVIRQAIQAHYADPDIAKEGHRYAAGVHRVIQSDRWEHWAHGSVAQLGFIEDGYTREQKLRWMHEWLENPDCRWGAERGPKPDLPGCRIPEDVMLEAGYTPPRRKAQ